MKDITDLSVINEFGIDFVRKFKFAYVMNCGKSAIIITSDDSVYVCGNNNRGCLGLGHKESVHVPIKLEQLCNKKVINIIDDNWYMYALTSDGHIYFWGYYNTRIRLLDCNEEICLKPTVVELLMDKFMVNIACGDRYWLGLTINGEVYEWGLSFISETSIPYPQLVSELKLHTVVDISCGSHHAIALTDSGVVFSWGSNEFGQLGCGSNDNTEDPIKVEGLGEKKATKISCGHSHSLVLTESGDIYTFGGSEGFTIATLIETIDTKFVDIATLGYKLDIRMSIGLSNDGYCYVWGEVGHQIVVIPTKSEFKNIEDVLHNYNNKRITFKSVYFKKKFNNFSVYERLEELFDKPQCSDVKFIVDGKYIFMRRNLI